MRQNAKRGAAMTRKNTPPTTGGTSDPDFANDTVRYVPLRVDEKKTLVPRLNRARAKAAFSPAGAWQIDELTSRLPWRATTSRDLAITFARIGILRANDDARGALGRARGLRETKLCISKGDVILGGRLPDLIEQSSTEHSDFFAFATDQAGKKLGLDAITPDALRHAARGQAGDRQDIEATAFVQSLAQWWWRNTGREPERRRKVGARADLKRVRALSFVEFAVAAWADSGGGVLSEKTIRRALDGFKFGPPTEL
jgi:hypothetical protein